MVKQGDEYWVPEAVRAYLRAQGYSTRALEDMEPHIRNGILGCGLLGSVRVKQNAPGSTRSRGHSA